MEWTSPRAPNEQVKGGESELLAAVFSSSSPFIFSDVGMALGHKPLNGREWMCSIVTLRENKIFIFASSGRVWDALRSVENVVPFKTA